MTTSSSTKKTKSSGLKGWSFSFFPIHSFCTISDDGDDGGDAGHDDAAAGAAERGDADDAADGDVRAEAVAAAGYARAAGPAHNSTANSKRHSTGGLRYRSAPRPAPQLLSPTS